MNIWDTWKIADYQNKIWGCQTRRGYYQRLIDGYNLEKYFMCVSLQRLKEMRSRLDRVTEQFEQCHRISSARVGNTGGLHHINPNLVNRLTTGMNEAVNGAQYQSALSGIWNQYSEIDAKTQNKQNRVNTLDSSIAQCDRQIKYCNNQIAGYEREIRRLKAQGK